MFTIGRSPRGRASLMHELDPNRGRVTLCGVDVSMGSRAWLETAIEEVLCMRCIASRARRNRLGLR